MDKEELRTEELKLAAGLFYVSFAKPKPVGWLGAVIVFAHGPVTALERCDELGINPGGDVMITQFPASVPLRMIDRLLTWEELEGTFGELVRLVPASAKGATKSIITIERGTKGVADKAWEGASLGMYILNEDGTPVPETDSLKWTKWFGSHERHVTYTVLGDVEVSTTFLGFDHNFSPMLDPLTYEPVLWETMVFGGSLDNYQCRYTSKEAAQAGHDEIVEQVKAEAENQNAIPIFERVRRRLKRLYGWLETKLRRLADGLA